MDLKGRNVLITGAARRLGAFLAIKLSEIGANLFIHYNLSERDVLKVKKICEENGSKTVLIKSDLYSSPVELLKVVNKIDVLICNASEFKKVELEKITEDDLIRSLKIEFVSHFTLIKKLWLESKRSRRISKVIVISDAWHVRKDFFPYHIGKNLLEFTTKELSKFFAPYLTVNCISLGFILPPDGKDDDYLKKLVKKIPMKRQGKMDEVFSAVKFLIENDYITGQILRVSGGV